MAIYNQATTLSRGGVAPSVQYNAAIRMPTQPMPDLPDVNSSFNIDLRPIGEAMIATKELEHKKEQAELDRVEKRMLMLDQFAHDYDMKTMELSSLEARAKAANDIAWYNAYTDRLKAEKDQEKDGYSLAKRIATQWMLNKYKSIAADVAAGESLPTKLKATEKQLVNDFDSTFGGMVPISDVIEGVRKVYPTALQSIVNASVAQQEQVVKGYEKQTEDRANGIYAVHNSFGTNIEDSHTLYTRLDNDFNTARRSLEIMNDPNAPQENKEQAKKDFNKAVVDSAGLASLATLGDEIIKGRTDVAAVRETFMEKATQLGADAVLADQLYKDWDRKRGLSENINTIAKLDKDLVDRHSDAVKKIIISGKLNLLRSNKTIKNFAILDGVSPKLGQIFLDTGAAEGIVSNISNGSLPNVKRDAGYATITFGGSTVTLDPEQIRDIEKDGMSLEDAIMTSYSQMTLDALNGDDIVDGSKMAANFIVPASSSDKDIVSSAANIDNIVSNTTSVADVIRKCENSNDRFCKVFSGSYKIKSALGDIQYMELSRQLKQAIPNEFITDSIKGGVIEIIPQTDGTIILNRDSYGFAGGTGWEQASKNLYEAQTTMNKLPQDVTMEEKIAFLEAHLTDSHTGDKRFIRRYTGYKAPVTEQIKEGAQRVVGSPVGVGAILDTAATNALTGTAKQVTPNMTGEGRVSSANAPLVEQPEEERKGDVKAVWIDAETGEPAPLKESEASEDISETIKVAYDGEAEDTSVYTIYDLGVGKAYKVQLPSDTETTFKDLYEMFKSGELKVVKEFDYVQ